jgi:hypothetical protein
MKMPRKKSKLRSIRAPFIASMVAAVVAMTMLGMLVRGNMRISQAMSPTTAEAALIDIFPLEIVLTADILRKNEEGTRYLYLVPGAEVDSVVRVNCTRREDEYKRCSVVGIEEVHR